jgi:hypothetical protein
VIEQQTQDLERPVLNSNPKAGRAASQARQVVPGQENLDQFDLIVEDDILEVVMQLDRACSVVE